MKHKFYRVLVQNIQFMYVDVEASDSGAAKEKALEWAERPKTKHDGYGPEVFNVHPVVTDCLAIYEEKI